VGPGERLWVQPPHLWVQPHGSPPPQPLRVRGCLLTLVERMDEEFTKIMQNTDPHSQGPRVPHPTAGPGAVGRAPQLVGRAPQSTWSG